ncbi:MAG TPA: serine/threonine-protein kinase, partial [Polyangiaceae bacterium]|nr:serine/threonine-protein kinase [Polyangiaceae bacterium]
MPAREPGQLLADKYRLIRLLGQGGMGSVWHAQHLMLNAPVALKFIESERLDAAAQQRFLGEARMAAALRSPHVVQILDYGVHEGTPHFAMELLEGESLAARLERVGRLDLAQTARVVQHVCRAITRAHDAGVIHRDLKPANVFIVRNDDDELLKVLDFGIAKGNPEALGQSAAAATRSGALLGTPQYMSPEQLDGAGAVDLRTDIWALGVLTYACLTGELPFAGDSVGRLVLAICSRPLPVPSERAAVPPGFDAWFARACARDREQRFGSARLAASEFAALARAASSPGHQRLEPLPGPAPAPPPAAPSPLGLDSTIQATQAEAPPAAAGRPPRWRRAAALVGVAALMLAVVGVARLAATSGSGAPPTTAPTAAAPAEATGTAPRAATASAARRRSVAMISLRNTAGRAADAWLGTALADLLRTELESGDQLRSVTRERVATLKRDLEFPETDSLERNLLTRIHDILDADMTLAGSYWRLGESDDLRMDVTLQDARSGETLASVAEHGPASNLFELVARAGERLRRKLGAESLSPAQLAQLQRSLPNDAEARGWYAEARERLDRTEYLAASELLGKVVEREPGFALGHALLSEAWAAIAYDTKAAAAAERARELSGDLPRKDQL